MGLENVELAGKSFNSGRKSLEEAGFIWMETTETGRQIFEHPETGARVTFDSGAALVPGQSPHWEMSDRGGTRYDRSGRPVVGPSPIMGGKHIPAG